MRPPPIQPINPWLEDRLRRMGHAGPVLDLGCGRGFWLGWMVQEGMTPIGVEHDASRARQGAHLAPVVAADGARLPLAAGSVDLVWCIHVLHHLPAPAVVLDEVRRVLRPGGHLILAETVEDNPVVRIGRRIWPHWDGVDIEARFTAAGLVEMVVAAGLLPDEERQHSLVSFGAWALPAPVARRSWHALQAVEERLPAGLNRWGAHLELVARAR